MTELPKIVPKMVYDRLQAAVPERVHPDADLLTAFTEQRLSVTERDSVLEHLALCGDCRDVIALALPAPDIVAAPVANETEADRAVSRAGVPARHQRRFAWPSLPWTALAAGVAVVAAVLLLHPGKLNLAILPSANRQIATTVPPASIPQIASSSSLSLSSSSSLDQSEDLAKSEDKTGEVRPKAELRLSKKLKTGQVVKPPLPAASGFLLADNEKDSGVADKLSAAPSAGARAAAPISRGTTETVEVSGAAAAVAMEPSTENALMARNEAPAIEKAKPALQGVEAQGVEAQGVEVNERQKTETAVVPGPARLQARNVMSAAKLTSPASPALAHNITWAITAGVLQRSLDSGRSWQNAVRADHPLLCYASHDDDVWTGGQAGTLFHSADSGATWVRVQPSIKGQALSSDITHIDVRRRDVRGNLSGNVRGDVSGLAEIVISTGNNELWNSADGGRTWEKK